MIGRTRMLTTALRLAKRRIFVTKNAHSSIHDEASHRAICIAYKQTFLQLKHELSRMGMLVTITTCHTRLYANTEILGKHASSKHS